MNPDQNPRRASQCRLAILALAAALLSACGGGGGGSATSDNDSSSNTAGAPSPAVTTPTTPVVPGTPSQTVQVGNTSGRLLASNCFQCHGTEGTGGFDNIRGESASEIKEFLTKAANSNIMAAHVQGYTVAQIDAIAAYLNQ
jgi:mono/diheme cytochrome c family protein